MKQIQILSILTAKDRQRGLAVVAMIAVVALIDTVSIASITPFLAALSQPDLVEHMPVFGRVFESGRFGDKATFILLLGFFAFGMLMISGVARIGQIFITTRYMQRMRHSLNMRLMEGYLRQPYAFFLNRNSGTLLQNILPEVDGFIDRTLVPTSQIVSSIFVISMVLLLLFFVDPITTLIIISVLLTTYAAIFLFTKAKVTRLGKDRLEASQTLYRTTNEALTGVKTVKGMQREDSYMARFRDPSLTLSRVNVSATLYANAPRFLVEAIAMGGIILIAIVVIYREGENLEQGAGTILPLLGLYALAGYRMLPAVQGIYNSMSSMRFAKPIIDKLASELSLIEARPDTPKIGAARMRFDHELHLRDASFQFPGAAANGLKEVNLTLARGERLGIVGTTGAGKTTLVDIILGLLSPTSGHVEVDGQPITAENRHLWLANVGYVPQDVYLCDASIAENIAFGLPYDQIDQTVVEHCARVAQIHDFVMSELPNGYATTVGERGVRLSGGQRQRIGIARSLYRDPDLIIFDEATSALDNLTEAEVVAAFAALGKEKTMIMVAHRLTTIRHCDQVIVLEKGRVIGAGTFDTLANDNPVFAAMVHSVSGA
jgi:ATP-binding cassette, subfamily B, bacterial PglK